MGWDSQHAEKGEPTIDILRRDLNGEYEILAHAVKGGAAYLAIRNRSEGDEGRVEAAVVLVKRGGRDYFNFTTKWMSEDMGPNAAECPARILDLLSPTENGYAQEWRAKCRETIEKVKVSKAIKPGTKILFDRPMDFSDGVTRQLFTFVGRSKFVSQDGVQVNITSWRKRAYTVVLPGTEIPATAA